MKLNKKEFYTDKLSIYKYLGSWFSVKNHKQTKSFKLKYRNLFSMCVPEYAFNFDMDQLRLSKYHRVFIIISRSFYRQIIKFGLGIKKQSWLYASQLAELINTINYIINLNKKNNIYRRGNQNNWINSKLSSLNENLFTLINNSFFSEKIINDWRLIPKLNYIDLI